MTAAQVEALPENEAQTVLEAWVKAGKTELPISLRGSSSKSHARLAKKALYQLQSGGVKVEAPVVATPAPSAPATNPLQAVMSSQLGSGERVLFFATPSRGGGTEVYSAIVNDELGLAQFAVDKANRQKYRERLAQIQNDPDQHVMVVPFERVQLELGRAVAVCQARDFVIDADIMQALHRLKVTPQDPNFPIPPLEAGDTANRDAGAALHDEPEISEWLPSETDLVLLSASTSAVDALPLDDAGKKQKKLDVARRLADEKFTPEIRTLYARRLMYEAEYFDARGREKAAASARAEARRLFHEKEPSAFARQLYVKAVNSEKVARALAAPK